MHDLATLPGRIATVVDRYPSKTAAKDAAGVTLQQLRNWTSGRNEPSLMPTARLAAGVGVRVEWVTSGVGPMLVSEASAHTDGELLGRINQVVARVYREEGVVLSELELGRIAAREYDDALGTVAEQWPAVLHVLEQRLRRELRTESMGRRAASE